MTAHDEHLAMHRLWCAVYWHDRGNTLINTTAKTFLHGVWVLTLHDDLAAIVNINDCTIYDSQLRALIVRKAFLARLRTS